MTTDKFLLKSGVYKSTKIFSHYSLLTFLRFEQHIFAEFTNCLHILPLISWELFYRLSQKLLKIKIPLNGRHRNRIIYKVNEQIFLSTIRCLLFCNLTTMFFQNSQIICISPHYSLLTFFVKNNPKNRKFKKSLYIRRLWG